MKKGKLKVSAITVLIVFSLTLALASSATTAGVLQNISDGKSLHENLDISKITNEGGDPPEISSAASALTKEKEWYEYVNYSLEPVGAYKLSDEVRVVFYDPYDYSNSLVMEIDDTITDWSSANSLTASYTTGNSITTDVGKSTEVVSSVQVAKGRDENGGYTDSTSVTKVEGQIDTYNKSKGEDTVTTTTGWEKNSGSDLTVEASIGVDSSYVKDSVIVFGGRTDNYSQVIETGGDTEDTGWIRDHTTTTDNTHEEVSTWTKIADRVTTATGSSLSTNKSWSTEDSTTISKTYDATYFNEKGSPLQWKIVKYTVLMPMYYHVQCLIDGEWVTTDSSYCLLTTIQGTCRSWIQNNTAYYEHWGTGEPVTWNEFWGKFFTKEGLIEAYKNKLYPER